MAQTYAPGSFIYHRCLKAEIGWFQAHGWELVGEYREEGLDMALLRHASETEDSKND